MSQEATSRPAESDVTSASVRPSSSSSGGSNDGDGGLGFEDAMDAMIDDLLWDPWEERIEAQIVEQLLRGASPALRRRVAAQRAELKARQEAARREVARCRAESRRLREYTDLLRADVSGYTPAQREAYERDLHRRSNHLFGDH
ncbi:hypothetical protein ACP70R_032813 [Stipagrostis hirtigluma subsp. patula]